MSLLIKKIANIKLAQVSEDRFISWEAKGIFLFLETHLKPITYDLDNVESEIKIHSKSNISIEEIHNFIKELRELGYVRIEIGSK
jgi:hypothetical protein